MRASKFFTYFHELPINTEFDYQGNRYTKQSSRTAIMLGSRTALMQEYNRVFYMGMRDVCFKIN